MSVYTVKKSLNQKEIAKRVEGCRVYKDSMVPVPHRYDFSALSDNSLLCLWISSYGFHLDFYVKCAQLENKKEALGNAIYDVAENCSQSGGPLAERLLRNEKYKVVHSVEKNHKKQVTMLWILAYCVEEWRRRIMNGTWSYANERKVPGSTCDVRKSLDYMSRFQGYHIGDIGVMSHGQIVKFNIVEDPDGTGQMVVLERTDEEVGSEELSDDHAFKTFGTITGKSWNDVEDWDV